MFYNKTKNRVFPFFDSYSTIFDFNHSLIIRARHTLKGKTIYYDTAHICKKSIYVPSFFTVLVSLSAEHTYFYLNNKYCPNPVNCSSIETALLIKFKK